MTTNNVEIVGTANRPDRRATDATAICALGAIVLGLLVIVFA